MNEQSYDLLEEFPSRRNHSTRLLNISNRFNDSSSGRLSFSNSIEELRGDDSFSLIESTIDPICTARIVGDKDEFRKLQHDLRNSRMLTGAGTQQLLKEYIEKQGRKIAEQQDQDPQIRKVKDLSKQFSAKSFKNEPAKNFGVRLTHLVDSMKRSKGANPAA
mmetsp:Transcript_10124/g.14854  ORF Transcript_10124/g.14854 Transcript_10124/m.14854 type:complete len:162 (+) Transcript_10124:86-571(+)